MPKRTQSNITLTVAVTAHDEGRLLRPTLRSIAAAIELIVERGVSAELLLVLDNASDETLLEASRWLEPGRVAVPVRSVQHSFGDAGASRNAAALEARGDYLALCDGDDLVTRNYLASALEVAQDSPGPVIVHPSIVVSFGARSGIWRVPSTDDIDHQDLIRHNLWPSSSVSRRQTYLDHPYAQLDASLGFGPEDWYWNIETSIGGIPHRPAPGAMFFYRVRESGGVNNRHLRSILPSFDLDALAEALPFLESSSPVPASGIRRDWLRDLARLLYQTARPTLRAVTSGMSQARRERLYARARRLYGRARTVFRKAHPPRVLSTDVETALLEAAHLEPALSWTLNGFAGLAEWSPQNDGYAGILVDLFHQLRDHSDAIVAVPWVGIGGADLVSLNYARALHDAERFGGRVAMLATHLPERTIPELVPEGVKLVQVPIAWRKLDPDLQRRLLAQLFILLRPELVVSVNCFDVTNSLQLFGPQLAAVSPIYLTLFAWDKIGAGYPVNPITDDSRRSFLDDIAGLITDNTVTRGIVEEMLALGDDKVTVHRQPALPSLPELRTGTRSYNNDYFTPANPFRLLWPHRLDKEKRPDVLVELAKRLREENLPVSIHVYGSQVLSIDGEVLMKSLAAAGVEYHGPYTGGLLSLPIHDFHALLLTSESEGLPLVLVQSMLLGLPVISTAVGGVVDLITDGETGMLAADPDDIDGLVSGVRRLMASRDERRRIIHAAYDFAAEQHSWPAFIHLVNELH